MNERWTGIDGWPCEFSETSSGQDLAAAIRTLNGADRLTDEEVDRKASFLWETARVGENQELARNRPATMKGSEDELRKLDDLCCRLADHIEKMRRPAVDGLHAEGAPDLFGMVQNLRELQERAREAFSGLDAPEHTSGAKMIAATTVTEAAATVYTQVTGRAATFTTPPDFKVGKRSGPWIDFLAAVFHVVGIDASASSQASQLRARFASKIDK